ncbi:efflux RND transporter periplasmic adaptor subunit [Actimicrobium antarcticum]|uniref:Efflux RND transporter periplasmic adaptor subunit n=1 Tax=Actimicrobium antarcticum TaxID=1051899 RepID=A0ABP7SQ83_9BURK
MPDFLTRLIERRWLVAGMVLAVLAGGWGAWRWWNGPEVPVALVERSDVVQTVVASGRVESPLRVDIGSQVTGTVAAIPVAEGQSVSAGQRLITLEHSEASASVEQAQASVAQARARLRQIRELALPVALQASRQAEATLTTTQRQFARTRALQARGFVGQAQLDDAQRSLDVAQSQLRTAQLQVATSRNDGSDMLLASTALQQAEASLRVAQAKLGYTAITAPTAGTLIARNVEPGDVVQPGKVLMVLSPVGKTQLVVQIDERNLATVRLGQAALAAADAYPARRFTATVAYLNPSVDPQRGSVAVKLDVAAPPDWLRQDMTVSVDIDVARRTATLVAPTAAVRDMTGAQPWVIVVRNGRAVRQVVQTGIRGAGKVEILAGLQAGEQVLSGLLATVEDGDRVRPVAMAGIK